MKSTPLYIISLIVLLMTSCKESSTSSFPYDIPEGQDPRNTTYYFLRHAEKDTSNPQEKDPHLTDEGIRRANYMATYFADKDFDLFYSTDYSRTIQTLIPIVHKFKGTIQSYEAQKDTLFTEAFWKETYGKNVLVVGHSNTNPKFVNEIISEEKYQDLDESNYDVFFKVEVKKDLSLKDSMITREVPEDFTYN
ncbi:histidine phosphatase family protein [Psychroflexus sp. YR1-1]|uniref:Histidine phosphatase family protein n=1 Tax=Psychroflexus aurantiacus TaxID=2709310 RepID=A0A6B3R6M5_9FLAO|nr:phosphoglycerate mutase family protein [Psychroflexus aurantiacus]NEV93134.1 histidine phosphatase family protein [Psychroflexus aurantiacus]